MSDANASSSKNPFFLSALILAVAVVIYLFAVQPALMSIDKAKRDLDGLTDQLNVMERDLKDSARVKGMLAEIDENYLHKLEAIAEEAQNIPEMPNILPNEGNVLPVESIEGNVWQGIEGNVWEDIEGNVWESIECIDRRVFEHS